MVSKNVILRRFIPFIQFKENLSIRDLSDLNEVEALLGYQYTLLDCDQGFAEELSSIFYKRSFELIIGCLATKIGVANKRVLFIQRNGDCFLLKSCEDAGANIGYRALSAKFSPRDGKAWLLHKDVLGTEEAVSFLVTYYSLVVDLNTKSIWISTDS